MERCIELTSFLSFFPRYLLFEPDAMDETVRRKGNSILDFQFCVDMREIEDCCAVQDMRGRRGAGAAGRPTSSYLQLYWTGGKNNGKGGAGKGGKKSSTGRRHWNNPNRRGSAATAVVGKAGNGHFGAVANQSIFFIVNTEDVEQLVESIRCWIDTLAKARKALSRAAEKATREGNYEGMHMTSGKVPGFDDVRRRETLRR